MNLTEENYFSAENNMKYMGCSQYKAFCKCEAAALAELKGEWSRTESDALLQGSYIDAHFEGTLDVFVAKHPEMFKKDGTLKSQFEHLNYIIDRIENQPYMMHLFSGEKQKIMVGEISGVPFKIKIDSFLPHEAIVDGKVMKDFAPIYKDGEGRLPWFEAWGYDIQGAIYREIARQNTDETLPFILNAASKEKEPDLQVVELLPELLDFQLEQVKENAPRFDAIKKGIIEPTRCEQCDYCRHTRTVELMTSEEFYD